MIDLSSLDTDKWVLPTAKHLNKSISLSANVWSDTLSDWSDAPKQAIRRSTAPGKFWYRFEFWVSWKFV